MTITADDHEAVLTSALLGRRKASREGLVESRVGGVDGGTVADAVVDPLEILIPSEFGCGILD